MSSGNKSIAAKTVMWQVEWSVAQRPGQYQVTPPWPQMQVSRQYFANSEDANRFKQSLVAAAALLGTAVFPTLSEVEVK